MLYTAETLRAFGTGSHSKEQVATAAADTVSNPFDCYVNWYCETFGYRPTRLDEDEIDAILRRHPNGSGPGWHDDMLAVSWEFLLRGCDTASIRRIPEPYCVVTVATIRTSGR